MQLSRIIAAAGLVGTAAIGASAAAASTTPKAGAISVFVTPSQTDQIHGMIVVTGVIGDYGTTTSQDKNGKPDANGNFEKIVLKQGSFIVDGTALNKKLDSAQPVFNATTCSEAFMGSGPSPIAPGTGTGLYAGIAGNVTFTVVFAGIAPRYTTGSKKGQCNLSENAEPVASFSSLQGSGNVTFAG